MHTRKTNESYIEYTRRIWTRREEPISWFFPYGLLLLLLFLGLMIFAGLYAAKDIESQIKEDAQKLLVDENSSWVKVEANGQSLHLSGQSPSLEDENKVVKLVEKLKSNTFYGFFGLGLFPSITSIDTDFTRLQPKILPVKKPVLVAKRHFDWDAKWNGSKLVFTAEVGSLAEKTALHKTVLDTFPTAETNISITKGQHFPEYLNESRKLLTSLKLTSKGEAKMVNGQSFLTAEIPNKEQEIKTIAAFGELSNEGQDFNRGPIELIISAEADQCDSQLQSLLTKQKIQFETAKAFISPSSQQLLQQIATIAATCPGHLQINGHTDSIGEEQMNLELSQARAEAVKQSLLTKGVKSEKLKAVGHGELKPIGDNTTRIGRALNRRIEIKVMR